MRRYRLNVMVSLCYLTIQQIQQYINDELLKEEDGVPTEVLDMHEERYHALS